MKRETLRHPKTYELAAKLDISRPHALGTLQLLWDYTGEVAPGGDIGKWSDAAIETAVDWQGDAGALVAALVACRWLDVDETHRLVVHDWPDHCEDWVRKKVKRMVARGELGFLEGYTGFHASRQCPASVPPPSHQRRPKVVPSNPIQSNPLVNVNETTIEIDWDAAYEIALHHLSGLDTSNWNETDKRLLLEACALVQIGRLSEHCLADSINALKQASRKADPKKRPRRPGAYLTKCLTSKAEEDGKDFKQLRAEITVPDEIMKRKES